MKCFYTYEWPSRVTKLIPDYVHVHMYSILPCSNTYIEISQKEHLTILVVFFYNIEVLRIIEKLQ